MKISLVFRRVTALLLVCILILPSAVFSAGAQETSSAYVLYPQVREYRELSGSCTLEGAVFLDCSPLLSEAATRRIKDALDTLPGAIRYATNEEKAIPILIGVAGDGSAAAQALQTVSTKITVQSKGQTIADADLFTHPAIHDGYILQITPERIVLLGASPDAVLCGVATLEQIIQQACQQNTAQLHALIIRDYASVALRGFSDDPNSPSWSQADRLSLIEWAGRFKMNTYLYRASSDQKRSVNWRTSYTEAELSDFSVLAAAGAQSGCKPVYSIAPFSGQALRFDSNYQTDFDILRSKCTALYQAGIRCFALDLQNAAALSADQLQQLCQDFDQWLGSNSDTTSLIVLPPNSNNNESDAAAYRRLGQLDETLDDDVFLTWNGRSQYGAAARTDAELFTRNIATNYYHNPSAAVRAPLLLLNWAQSSLSPGTLTLGPGSNEGGSTPSGTTSPAILHQSEADWFSGILVTGMQQPTLNRIPFFAAADFAWNDDAYQGQQSWYDSFTLLFENIAEPLRKVAQHLSSPLPNKDNFLCGESEQLHPLLTKYEEMIASGTTDNALSQQLLQAFAEIEDACAVLLRSIDDPELLSELKPFCTALSALCQSAQVSMGGVQALQEGRPDAVWEAVRQSNLLLKQAQSQTVIPQTDGSFVSARAGTRYLEPFVCHLIEVLESGLLKQYDPSRLTPTVFLDGLLDRWQSGQGNEIDGNPSTTAILSSSSLPSPSSINPFPSGSVIFGLTYQTPTRVQNFRVLTSSPGGSLKGAVLQYRTADSVLFQNAPNGAFSGSAVWDFSDAPLENVVEIRVVNTEPLPNRVYLKEIGIVPEDCTLAYSNAAAYRTLTVKQTSDQAALLPTADTITLMPGEFIGIRFPGVYALRGITLRTTGGSGLTLEASKNGITFQSISTSATQPARVLRLINRTASPIIFTLQEFTAAHQPVDLTFEGTAAATGTSVSALTDGDFNTAYQPVSSSGSLTYTLPDSRKIQSLALLQDPQSPIRGDIYVYTAYGTEHLLGSFQGSLSVFDLSSFETVSQIKLCWQGATPTFYELLLGENRPAETDKRELSAAIHEAEALDTTGHSPDLVTALQTAIEQARSVNGNPHVGQPQINAAIQTLQDAIKALQLDQQASTQPVCCTDRTTGVGIYAAAGVLPNRTELDVEEHTQDKLFRTAKDAMTDLASEFSLYTLSLVLPLEDESTALQPQNGNLAIYLPVPKNVSSKQIAVYEMTTDGRLKTLSFTVQEADHVPEGIGKKGESFAVFSVSSLPEETGYLLAVLHDASGVKKYAVNAKENDGGVLRIDQELASAGATVSVTVRPDEGQKLVSLSVITKSGESLALNALSENFYTFRMPEEKVTVSAEFEASAPTVSVTGWSCPFVDLPSSAWYYDSVAYLCLHGCMKGVSETSFQPDTAFTRAMMAQVLYNMEGAPLYAPYGFSDVPSGIWYEAPANWCARNGIMIGLSEDTFGPNMTLTRETAVTTLYRYAAQKAALDPVNTVNTLAKYADGAAVSSWAQDAMAWAADNELLHLTHPALLSPQSIVSRGEFAGLLAAVCVRYNLFS